MCLVVITLNTDHPRPVTSSTDLNPIKIKMNNTEFEKIGRDINDRVPRFGLKSNLAYKK